MCRQMSQSTASLAVPLHQREASGWEVRTATTTRQQLAGCGGASLVFQKRRVGGVKVTVQAVGRQGPGRHGSASVVYRLAADLVVGMKQRLGQEVADVGSAQPIDDPPAVPAALNEAGEAELGQMLARDGRPAAGRVGQRGNVGILVAERSEQPHAGRFGQQRKRHDRRLHPGVVELVKVG